MVQLLRLFHYHYLARPLLQAQDLAKVLYQAAFGVSHLLNDLEQANAGLLDEMRGLAEAMGGAVPFGTEPMAEPVTVDSRLVRINLRPYGVAGGCPRALFQAMVDTAQGFPEKPEGMAAQLRGFLHLEDRIGNMGVELPLPRTLWEEFLASIPHLLQRLETNSLPPVAHSRIYRERYRPAYRVVAYSCGRSLLRSKGPRARSE